MADEHHNQNMW